MMLFFSEALLPELIAAETRLLPRGKFYVGTGAIWGLPKIGVPCLGVPVGGGGGGIEGVDTLFWGIYPYLSGQPTQ